jgi:hypothetical protein
MASKNSFLDKFPKLKQRQLMDFTMLYDANGDKVGYEFGGVLTIFKEYEHGYEFYCKALEHDLPIRVVSMEGV